MPLPGLGIFLTGMGQIPFYLRFDGCNFLTVAQGYQEKSLPPPNIQKQRFPYPNVKKLIKLLGSVPKFKGLHWEKIK